VIRQPCDFKRDFDFVLLQLADTVTVTVTVTINGLVKLSAFNAHICPSKYLASF